ncbi:hypothetical protein PILCRDRAFT_9839 [Piloderma croceum F 1598]|uniref:Uncharacterized protein n=1 Tax=Piloderma croceum (strain F 1598) TaxID=765440 RepID=A0A0C3F5G3_PILCF|nr:hypothetical protein PILCRDRAFT_9839 [Piloderma croceum F 1598]
MATPNPSLNISADSGGPVNYVDEYPVDMDLSTVSPDDFGRLDRQVDIALAAHNTQTTTSTTLGIHSDLCLVPTTLPAGVPDHTMLKKSEYESKANRDIDKAFDNGFDHEWQSTSAPHQSNTPVVPCTTTVSSHHTPNPYPSPRSRSIRQQEDTIGACADIRYIRHTIHPLSIPNPKYFAVQGHQLLVFGNFFSASRYLSTKCDAGVEATLMVAMDEEHMYEWVMAQNGACDESN